MALEGHSQSIFSYETDGYPDIARSAAPTTCQVGDLKMTAGEAGNLLKATDIPFKSAKVVADVIIDRAKL